ncbi:MAG: helix-turn-helix domain-containing protein [Parvibaculum sp.]
MSTSPFPIPSAPALTVIESPSDKNRRVEERWTPALAKSFCPVSSYFLENYHRLKPHEGARGLNSTEAMLIVQMFDFKWDKAAPFPSLGTIARRMGISVRQVRDIVKRLEGLGYLKRVPRKYGGSNAIEFSGLFKALETLQSEDASTLDDATAAEVSL